MNREKEKVGKYWNSARYVMTGLLLLLFTMVSTGLFLPGAAKAEEGYGPGTDRFKIELGAFFPSISTELQADRRDPILDLEPNLGLSENDSIFRLDGYWRFARKHRVAFGYYRLNRDARKTITGDIEIGDEIWYAGALVDSDLTMDFYQINYLYSFYQGEKWEIAGSIGTYWVRVKTTIALAVKLSSPPFPEDVEKSARFESDTFEGPLPLLGLTFDYYITPKWLVTLKGGYFQLTINDYEGRIMNLGANLEYQFTKTFGLGLGYDSFRLKVEADKADGFASVDYKYHGVQVYGILRF